MRETKSNVYTLSIMHPDLYRVDFNFHSLQVQDFLGCKDL